MQSISQYTADIPKERVALFSKDGALSFHDLRELREKSQGTLEGLAGKAVAIYGTRRFDLACLLYLLDGVAAKLLLVPQDIEPELFEQFAIAEQVQYKAHLQNGFIMIDKIGTEQKSIVQFEHTHWIIPTSGTTGTPKLIAHNLRSLTKTTQLNKEKGRQFRWGLVFDLYRFSGIQVYMQAILNGSSLIVAESDDSFVDIYQLFAANDCNAISSTPSFWRQFLMVPHIGSLKLKKITLGGEISDEQILKMLRVTFPETTITHIYASTEVGSVFSVSDGQAGFPLQYLQEGTAKFEFQINDQGMLLIRPRGEAQSFIETGDMVQVQGERVHFLGRESGAINVGGNKVMPEEVEAHILALSSVAAVRVFGKKNPILGALVAAEVQVSSGVIGDGELKKIILEHCRQSLASYKVPAFISFVDSFNFTSSGKIHRK